MSEEKKDPKQIAAEIMAKSNAKANRINVKVTRFGFLIVAALQFILVYVYMNKYFLPIEYLTIDLGIGIAFVIFFVLSFWYAKIAFMLGLGGYVLIQLYLISVDISFLAQGWIWKIIVLTTLIVGLIASFKIPPEKPQDDTILDL